MPISHLLTSDSLDFSRRHLTAYYDSDFFPKPFEFSCLWHKWEELKELAMSGKLNLPAGTPVSIPWKKPRGGYRVVHQLDPLDAVCYTAAVRAIADDIERARLPVSKRAACSYRIRPDHAGFFVAGSGFSEYRDRCEELASKYAFVLKTDISDFYNQIYIHRVNGAISEATRTNVGVSFERFLMNLYPSKNSQGIPVGPAASIVLSEAALIDIDQFISSKGFDHVRYVDDIRIFSISSRKLDLFLQELTHYLHQIHRLGLVGDKTRIVESEEFIKEELNNQYQLEKLEILEEIEVVNPYSMEVRTVEYVEIEDAGARLLDALRRTEKFENLDLGVARAIIRRARANKLPELFPYLLDNLDRLKPVVNDIVLYLEAVYSVATRDQMARQLSILAMAGDLEDPSLNEWFSWLISNHKGLLDSHDLRLIVSANGRARYLANAAVLTGNSSWVRNQKDHLLSVGPWDRRAIIFAGQILSDDEKAHWLKPLVKKFDSVLDKWMIEWVLAGTPVANPLPEPPELHDEFDPAISGFGEFEDDLPF